MMKPAVAGDQAARERIRTSLGESLIVEASAGTGKTSELTRRIVHVLATGAATVDRIVAVTFTNKAAGELKIRLRQGIDDARATAAGKFERDNLEAALARLEEAFVGTIHSFCAQILRERPVEARVDPAFEEITESQASRIYKEAFQRWFARRLDSDSPALRRALARLQWPDAWENLPPVERLMQAGRKLIEWRDFPTPWRRELFARKQRIDQLYAAIDRVAEMRNRSANTKDPLHSSMTAIAEFRVRTARQERRDYDSSEALLIRLGRDLGDAKGRGVSFAEGVSRAEMIDAREALRKELEDFEMRSSADLASALRGEFADLIEEYEQLKLRSGKLDFLDLLICVRNLVRGNRAVRHYLQQRYSHLFIDEFQDTDPLQAETLLLIASNDPEQTDWLEVTPAPGKLFAVGDPKQSIYKFRRADVDLYRQLRDALAGRGVGVLQLTTSFRSVRAIQECVNAAFAPLMTGGVDSGQAEYSNLEGHHATPLSQPSVIALPIPRPWGQTKMTKTAINSSLPASVAAFVDWLLAESGWTVRDPETEARVPVAASHICILLRRFLNFGEDITRTYVHEFEKRGIPHVLVGAKSFHKREEVETLRAALTAVEWPEDELSVFATLRGYLFAIDDALLLRYRMEIGRLNPLFDKPDAPVDFLPIGDALRVLKDLHRGRNRRPMAETVNALLEATRAHASFALRPAGPQVLANVYRVAELARSFEVTGGISFRGFVEELAAQADRTDSAEAPVLEHAAEGVRLMTVHTAKGLEFPVVILADTTANLSARVPDHFLDAVAGLCATRLIGCAPHELLENQGAELEKERAEGVRVAYVAATRARDLLVVPGAGDGMQEGWVGALNPAIYPVRGKWRTKVAAQGCPVFNGDETVLDRPFFVNDDSERSVHPGLHTPEAGTHTVVWWDPSALNLETEERLGLRQEETLTKFEPQASRSVDEYETWKADRAILIEQAKEESIELFNPSTAPRGAQEPTGAPPQVATTGMRGERPASQRFGTLVHLILRDVAWDGSNGEHLAELHGELLGAQADEIRAASAAVAAALAHPLLQRARRAKDRFRELPITLRVDEKRILEGVIDLAFVEDGRWVVVDFKTTADLNANQAAYSRQLLWYSHALDRIRPQRAPAEAWLFAI